VRTVAIALIGGILISAIQGVTSSGADPDPNPGGAAGTNPEPDFSLTDEEAIETFAKLRRTGLQAAEARDFSLLPLVYHPDSPMSDRAQEAIRNLQEDQIYDETRFKTVSLDVLESGREEIQLLERARVLPCFRSESGKDVSEGPNIFEWEVLWSLRFDQSRWLIEDSVAQEDEIIDGKNARC
jgi:hypothetical protein